MRGYSSLTHRNVVLDFEKVGKAKTILIFSWV